MHNSSEFQKVKEMIKNMKFAMLTTLDDQGCLHSRPMGTIAAKGENNSLWFFTADNSPKAFEILEHSNVNLSYCDADSNTYISISGTARIVKDKQKIHKFWSPYLRAWFPKGEDDPHICLIEVVPMRAQYWSYPDSTIYQAMQYLKKFTSGNDAEAPDFKKIDLT